VPRNVYSLHHSAHVYAQAVIELGDPVDDLSVATVLMVVGGQLILLRPRKVHLPFDGALPSIELISTSPQIRKSTMTCKYLQIESSFAGFTSMALARWRTRCGPLTAKASGSG
jgi:hypothetical protein